MARGDDLYARLEVDFMRRMDFLELPVGARWLYLWLWCYSLSQHRSKIARPTNDLLASMSALPRHPVESYLNRLHNLNMIDLSPLYIELIGIEEKHKRFRWSSSPYGDRTPPVPSPTRARETETETETETDKKSKPKKETQKAKRKPKEEKPPKNYPVNFNNETESFEGITGEDLEAWKSKYDLINVGLEIEAAEVWYAKSPKAKRWKNCKRGIQVWLGRAQGWAEERAPKADGKNGKPGEFKNQSPEDYR